MLILYEAEPRMTEWQPHPRELLLYPDSEFKFSDISRDCKHDGPKMCEDFRKISSGAATARIKEISSSFHSDIYDFIFMIIEFRIKIMALI